MIAVKANPIPPEARSLVRRPEGKSEPEYIRPDPLTSGAALTKRLRTGSPVLGDEA
jgi:hypothetical protein